ncbi:hypothetical protein IAT40_001695 [Kwoniella sp. CBS 6097]
MTHRSTPTTLSTHAALPPDVLLEVFNHLTTAGSIKSLANMRQVNKAMYFLVTPSLMAQYELSLRSLLSFTHELVEVSRSISAAFDDDNEFFSPARSASTSRRQYDFRFVRKLLADNVLPSVPSDSTPEANGQSLQAYKHSLEMSSEDRGYEARLTSSLLPRLNTLIIPATSLRAYSLGPFEDLESSSASTSPNTDFVPYSKISPTFGYHDSLTQKITRLVIRYPTVIHDDIDADLASSPLSTYLRSLVNDLPILEDIQYENMHLQPIALRLPSYDVTRNTTRRHAVVFSRHARTPDMGGVVAHLRKQQIVSSLALLIENVCKRMEERRFIWGEPELSSILEGKSDLVLDPRMRYEFVDAIGSIPQWDTRSPEQRAREKIGLENFIQQALDKQFKSIADGSPIAEFVLQYFKTHFYLIESDT